MPFLPVNADDIMERGWDGVDFVLVTGDAYVDHPSFGAAVIGRVLESAGYRVFVLAQPNMENPDTWRAFPKPSLGFLITGGNIDSMVNHYTVAKKRREKDLYAPGGRIGLRPDRAVMAYGRKIRAAYPDAPIILGGLEASLRRLSHYDYWDNRVRRSILLDAEADLLVYGMGEQQIVEIAQCLETLPVSQVTFVKGTVYKTRDLNSVYDAVTLPPFQAVRADKRSYANSFLTQYNHTDPFTAQTLTEDYGDCFVVQNPPAPPLPEQALDDIYALPYMRTYHPMYEKDGGVPGITEVKFSLTSSRGCFGSCNFCALTFHQGRIVQARSHDSLLKEAKTLIQDPDFKGYIHDVGGPTANFRQPACEKQATKGACVRKRCLFPAPCPELAVSHADYLALLRKLRALPGVKKVFIRSGLRYDYLMLDKDGTFMKELCKHHISGQLKVAPEHISDKVLDKMGKPKKQLYESFRKAYTAVNKTLGMNQFLIPYFMSSHPGSDLSAAVELAEYLRDVKYTPEQVQDFYPTPGTLSTCMYYTQTDPRTHEPVTVPKTPHEKAMQRALMQYKNPRNAALVMEALKKAGREDLIGFGTRCLIRPLPGQKPAFTIKEPKPAAKSLRKKTIRNIHKKKK